MGDAPPRVIVADSSVLIALAKVGRLDLLRDLFGRITVPDAVWGEVTAEGDRPGATAVAAEAWIEVVQADRALAIAHEVLVDAGEAAAIAVAQRSPLSLLLLDDSRGRRLALRLGITIKGTLGVLVMAKQRGLLSEVRPLLDDLERNGLYLSGELRAVTLRAAREEG